MEDSIHSAELFLINTVFDLYLFILMVRFLLCWVRADYFNPITQFIVKVTQPLVGPLRRILPTYKSIEYSSLVWLLILETLKFFLVGLIALGLPKNPAGLLILSSADIIKLVLNTFFYAIFLQAIMSWMHQGYSPILRLLDQLTSPIMRPIQRYIPTLGGFDISPIFALIILQLLIILLVNPLMGLGMAVAFG